MTVPTNTSRRQFLNKKELAAYLGLSIFTINSWVSQRREVPFVKMGRRVMFDMGDVRAWVDANKVQPVEFDC
jgi:excisionase family DNA binding protein